MSARVDFIKAEVARTGQSIHRPPENHFFVPGGLSMSLQVWTHLQPRDAMGHVPINGDETTYRALLRVLKGCGFWVGWDRHWGRRRKGQKRRETQWKRRTLHQGGWGRLRFHSSVSGLHNEFNFYFDGYTENPHGPRYGFHHREHIDHWTRLRMEFAIGKLRAALLERGFVDRTQPDFADPYERIEYEVRDCWHFKGEASIWEPRKVESYNATDANGRRLVNGELRYFYDYRTGRLMRGRLCLTIPDPARNVRQRRET